MRTPIATIAIVLLTVPLPTLSAHSEGMKVSQGFVCIPEGGPEVYVPLTSSGCAKLVVKTRDPLTTCGWNAGIWRCHIIAHMELTVYGPLTCGWGQNGVVPQTLDACNEPDLTNPGGIVKVIESTEEESAWHTDIPAAGKIVTFQNTVCARPDGAAHGDIATEDCITFPHSVHLPGPRSATQNPVDLVLDFAGWIASWVPT